MLDFITAAMDQIDFRLLIGALAVLLAAATKGISGIGLLVVATPILAVLYDLPTAIAVAILPTALSDMPFLYTYRSEWRQALRFTPMIVAGMAGVFIGTQILIRVNQELLKAALGVSVLLFVVISWFHLLPRLSDRFATRWGAVVGLLAGILQGATGTSAPVITVFFYQLHLPRAAFLFLINIFFVMVDSIQVGSLVWVGVYTPRLFLLALAAAALVGPIVFLTLRLQKRINEQLFRRIVLLVLALSGLVLLSRVGS